MVRFIPVGEAVTRGEQKMLDYLQHALPDNWVVLGNAQFTTSELTCEVDAIVVGDRCIWVVDAKRFGARLRGDEHTWILVDGSDGNVYSTTCCTPPKWSAEDLLSRSKLGDLGAGGGASDIAQKLQNLHKYHALYRSEDYQPFAHVRLAEP